MLGLVGATGVLSPLFLYEDGKWTAPWPHMSEAPPSRVADIPNSWWPGFSAQSWSLLLPVKRPLELRSMVKHSICGDDWLTDVQTNYVENSPAPHFVGVAATGSVDVFAVESADLNAKPTDVFWQNAKAQLNGWLRKLGRHPKQIKLDEAARIPRPDGTHVWELQAWIDGRFLRVWAGDQKEDFVVAFDGGDDEKRVRYINPIAAIWLRHDFSDPDLLILSRYSFYDGREFAIFRITSDGVAPVITGYGGGC
jgi:hypothetical protein